MPPVWYLKLRFPGALRNNTPGLRGGDDPAAVAARTGHPFSPSVAAYFYRKNQFVPDSIVDAIAPFMDLPMGTDLLHGSFAFRAVPEGLSLIHFFLHVGGLDAMLVCLNHLLTIFPASLRTDWAKITTWSRFWLSERSITRKNISLMDEDDPSVDTSYPVTFPMALALAAMTVWNRAAIERLLDGDYGEAAPSFLRWVRGRERHASMSYYAWDHADYALFKVLFERYDLPLLDEMDAETRFDIGAGLAPFLDEGHHDQIPRFAELGLINNDSWTRILASALDTPKVLEPTMIIAYFTEYIIELLKVGSTNDKDKDDEDEDGSDSSTNSGGSTGIETEGYDLSVLALFDVLAQVMKRYPHGFNSSNNEVTTFLCSTLRAHYDVEALAKTDPELVTAASNSHRAAKLLDMRLFIKLAE
ncbi:hypothetical protein H9P43_007670 [Blastocladiella emersonii ATCC 22665]|nr:hypothetical protein H9P43_007670 [Blastocladiella emersonii ATCC 22665]